MSHALLTYQSVKAYVKLDTVGHNALLQRMPPEHDFTVT